MLNLLPVSRSKVIQDLKSRQNRTVVYHYCDFQDTASTSPATILRNIFVQLLPVNRDWTKDFSDLVSRKDKRESPPTRLEDICEMVRRAAKYHDRIVVAVDALDECNENRSDFVKLLLGLDMGISLFVTSRKEHDIAKVFLNKPYVSLDDEKSRIEADMKAYIDNELQKNPEVSELLDDQKAEVTDTLVEKADGM